MQYCPKCRIHVRGYKRCCPLCQGELTTEQSPEENEAQAAFPHEERSIVSGMSVFRVVTFLCVSAEIVLLALEVLSGFTLAWYAVVMAGILIGWVDFLVAMYYRNNIIRLVTIEGYVIMALCVGIDLYTGWRGWSVAFVMPTLFGLLIFVTLILGLTTYRHLEEYITYIFFDLVFSFVQVPLIVTGKNPHIEMAVLCMTIMAIAAAAALIFRSRELRRALEKLMHI